MVFAGWGSWVARFRWPVLMVALVAVIGAGLWGLGVFGELTEGGYNDPNSESTHAGQVVQDTFGVQGGDLVVIYTPTKGKIDDAALGKRVKDSLAKLPKSAATASTSYWSSRSAQYAAKNKSSAVAVITLAGDDDAAKLDSYRAIAGKFAVDGAKVQLSGAVALADASSTRSTDDLGTAELISLPITLILLVLIFGSLVAASLPVLVGGAAVLGSLGILHAIAAGTDVNSFAVNVASLLGLGMAIDYGLFMVGRFREELAGGRTPSEAVSRTVGTAGRTVVFSATLLMIALAGLLLFPQGFLNSLAYGGLAAVFLAAVLSLTLLPAMLAVLGPRVDKIPVHLPRRAGAAPSGSSWTKLAGVVLRNPLVVALPILAFLLLLASPIRGVHFGENDERILPANDPSRQAIETLKADYPQFAGDNVQIVLRHAASSADFAVQLRQIPGIAQIGAARKDKDVTLFTATLKSKDAYSGEARDVVDAIRALPVPPGAQLLVGGTTARNNDSLEATADKLPWMVLMLVGATLLLMFLAFGSVVLPIKAVLMSALSLCATFGVLVWIFQDGHFSSLLDVTPAPLEVGIVVLMAAVVFGLSTDYEVFLLSRMVEARTRGASTDEAVTTGLARTGRVISAAALLLIVVTGAFALSAVTTMRFVGVGMIIALLLDATIVRMLLVPAVLKLLGDAAWWAPGPLRRLQRRAGLSEYAGEQPDSPAGRHAALDETQVIRYAPYGAHGQALPALPAGAAGVEPTRHALPSASPAFALPTGSLSADDATQVFARFEETAVINLPAGSPPLEEVEAETVDESPVRSSSADDDSIVDAEILDDQPDYDAPYEDEPGRYATPAASAESWELPAGAGESESESDTPAFVEAASTPVWDLPATNPALVEATEWLPAGSSFESNAPRADWTVADDDGFFFSPPPATPDLPPTPLRPAEASSSSGEEEVVFAEPEAAVAEAAPADEPAPAFTEPEPSFAEPEPSFAEPTFAKAALPEPEPSFAEPEPSFAEPEPTFAEPMPTFAEPTPTFAEAAPVAEPVLAEPEPAFADPEPAFADPEPAFADPEPAGAELEPVVDEPADEPFADVEADVVEPVRAEFAAEPVPVEAVEEQFSAGRARAIYRPFVPEPAEYVADTYVPAPAEAAERTGRRPSSLADNFPVRGASNTVSRPADLGAYNHERAPGQVGDVSRQPIGLDGQTSTQRPATLGDQPLRPRPVPLPPEPQSMTEPEPQPQAAAGPATTAPADIPAPPPAPAPQAPAVPPFASAPTASAAPFTPMPRRPDAHPVQSAPADIPAPPPAPTPQAPAVPPFAPERAASPTPFTPMPRRPDAHPVQPAPGPATPDALPVRPAAAAAPAPHAPATAPHTPTPHAPATAPHTPTPHTPTPHTPTPHAPAPHAPATAPHAPAPNSSPVPSPAAAGAVPGFNAQPGAGRRPADLADHLRESRPADLNDYTTGRIPRMRRALEEKPKSRRPATLADHLSARKSGEEVTRDLRDHAAQE